MLIIKKYRLGIILVPIAYIFSASLYAKEQGASLASSSIDNICEDGLEQSKDLPSICYRIGGTAKVCPDGAKLTYKSAPIGAGSYDCRKEGKTHPRRRDTFCPTGYKQIGYSCGKVTSKITRYSRYPAGSVTYLSDYTGYMNFGIDNVYWNGKHVAGGSWGSLIELDNYVYVKGRKLASSNHNNYHEVVRYERWKDIGYCKSGTFYNRKTKVCQEPSTITPVHKYCGTKTFASALPNYNRADGTCTEKKNYAAFNLNTIKRKLYYQIDSRNEKAAFRYLALFINQAKTNNPLVTSISDFYGPEERETANSELAEVVGFYPKAAENSELNKFLVDIYFNRAQAELLQAREYQNKSKVSWLEKRALKDVIGQHHKAFDGLELALREYWPLFTTYSNAIKISGQSLINPLLQHTGSGEAFMKTRELVNLQMLYGIFNNLLKQKVELSRLAIISGEDKYSLEEMVLQISALRDDIESKHSTIKALLSSDSANSAELQAQFASLEGNLSSLDLANNWLTGDSSIFNLPDSSVLLIQGYGIDGNQTYDSFNAMKAMAQEKGGALNEAIELFKRAKESHSNYRYTLTQFKNSFQQERRILNDQLFTLIGCTFEQGELDSCTDRTAKKGSQVAQQKRMIDGAIISIKNGEVNLSNLKQRIKIEENKLWEEKNIRDAISKISLRYGMLNIQLSSVLDKNSNGNSDELIKRSEQSLEIIKQYLDYMEQIDLETVNKALDDFNMSIKTLDQDDAKSLAAALAAVERAVLVSTESQLLDVNTKARIKNLVLDIETAKVDRQRARHSQFQETERLSGLLKQAKRIRVQLRESNNSNLARYYADPLHFSLLHSDITLAENAFQTLQEWLYYMAEALEYKWQEKFFDSQTGYRKDSLFRLTGIDELSRFYNSLVKFDNLRNLRGTQQAVDSLSLKKHVFGYYDQIYGKTQLYPSPSGDGQMLTADEAFREKLEILTRTYGNDRWITVNFSTVKELPRSNFFQGPILAEEDDLTCLVDGGTYLDKIEEIAVNLRVSYETSAEPSTTAYLTYGGNSVLRSRYPGKLSADGLGIEDEMFFYTAKFWDMTAGGLKSTNSFRQQMKANIVVSDQPDTTMTNSTFAFKEHSVAATGWRLSFKLSDRNGDIVDIHSLDDIEVKFKHRFKSRNFDSCNGGVGPLLMLR